MIASAAAVMIVVHKIAAEVYRSKVFSPATVASEVAVAQAVALRAVPAVAPQEPLPTP